MITEEPKIKVGIIERCRKVDGAFNGPYHLDNDQLMDGGFAARASGGQVILYDASGNVVARQDEIRCAPLNGSTFTLFDVTIGVHFHWERKEEQTFHGALILIPDESGNLVVINEIHLEDYLGSVISSEMNAQAHPEFLKAHAIISRSWLVATLKRARKANCPGKVSFGSVRQNDEIICWYDREDHALFDVCADDHCQRYQGITRFMTGNARDAVDVTRGIFLVYDNDICDARYHKACGGLTDNFENIWENTPVTYLTSVSDSAVPHNSIHTEDEAQRWILAGPDAYCNTRDDAVLKQILPYYDQETADFFRWEVTYPRKTLEGIIQEKSGIDFGNLLNLIPLERGPSGRIIRLKIVGTKHAITIGKELEIRRWLSRSHLLSSAFIVTAEGASTDPPVRFVLHGAGWGHGVGFCQIGAAVMATKGFRAEDILKHYFRETELKKLY